MAGWFGRGSRALTEVQATGSRLGIFTLVLTGVDEPFDPDPLWDRRYGGRAQIAEKGTGDAEFRLQAALDGCRNSTFERDEAGRFREENRVFTDVVMWIPEVSWRADSMRGGTRIEALQHALAGLHEEKFSRSLPADRAPRYTIMGDRELAADCVAFQFGFGVFVPGPDDVLEAEIGLVRPGETKLRPPPPWLFWQDGAQTRRPVGVYRGQRSLLISGSNEGPIRPDLWFSARSGHILMNLNEADAERIYSDSESIRVVEMREAPNLPGSIEWRLDSEIGGQRESLWVRIAPISEKQGQRSAMPPPTIGAAPLPRTPDPQRTVVSATPVEPRPSTPLSNRFSLHLIGIALLRIDPARMPGLEEWTIFLDDAGWPVGARNADGIDEPTCLALRCHVSSGHLQVRAAGSNEFRPAAPIPCSLATAAGGKLELLPSPLPDRHHALLSVPDSLVLPLSPQPLTLGRASSARESEPDLPIEVLNHPRSARWDARVTHASARLDAVELSRRHIRVVLRGDHLEVAMEKGNTPVYALDQNRERRLELAPHSPEVALLEPGQHVLLGSYVFRFHKEQAHTVTSTGVHRLPRSQN